jgi:hypothetical protein
MSSQSARLFLQSSELGPPTLPPNPRRVGPTFGSGEGHACGRGGGGGGPSLDEGTDTVVLYVLSMYFLHCA